MVRHLTILVVSIVLGVLPTHAAYARDDWSRETSPVRAGAAGQPREVAAVQPESAPAQRIDAPVFRLEIPFRTQKDGGRWQTSNCGPATLGMILDGFGLAGQATDDLRFRSHTYQGTVGMRTGTALQHIAQVAEDFGVRTYDLYADEGRFHAWTLDDVRRHLRLGRPVMPLVRLYALPGYENVGPRWGHYILVTGMTEDGFFYSDSLQADPAAGVGRIIPAAQLARAMQASHIPGQAVAFGSTGIASLRIWTPGQ